MLDLNGIAKSYLAFLYFNRNTIIYGLRLVFSNSSLSKEHNLKNSFETELNLILPPNKKLPQSSEGVLQDIRMNDILHFNVPVILGGLTYS